MTKQLVSLFVLLTTMLALSGCSVESLRTQAQRAVAQSRLAQEASSPPASPENQLLVTGVDGNLFLVDAATGTRFALTTDASPRRQYLQPTWSPDGAQIAWARVDGGRSTLEVSGFDGENRSEVAVPFPPFYFYWSPTGERLAYLSNWRSLDQASMALRLVEFEEGAASVRTLAEGQPFYFSWAPNGEQILTHVGNERVELLNLDGESQSLRISGGQFPAPQWAADGERLIYAEVDAQQRLIVTDVEGEELVELTDYPGRITFSLSPDNRQAAYVVTERTAATSTLGPLYVVDVDTLRTREVTSDPVVGFYWSPTGDRLAYLGVEVVGRRVGLRWYVWDGQRSTPYAGFFPSGLYMQNYLPFFDQYAQSHRVWSPDGSAFVYIGAVPDGRSGVWVQDVDAGGEPTLVGAGLSATWSPR
jgi:TolB protein